MSRLHGFASPAQFLRLADRVQPWTGWAAALFIGAGLVVGFGFSPADYQQGDTVRIMYVHVPSAWMALFCYAVMALCAAAGADLAPPAGACDRPRRGADRRLLHHRLPCHRNALGQTDVGPLVGLGRPPDLRADPAVPLSRLYRARERLRQHDARRPVFGDPGAGRRGQPAGHQVFGRLVEHAATSRPA